MTLRKKKRTFLENPVVIFLLIIGIVTAAVSYASQTNGYLFTNKIAIVKIEGVISPTSSFLSMVTTPDDVQEQIKKIEKNPAIKGVLFVINSPGGSVVASREIYESIRSIEKPKVCWMGDIAASGAYWVSLACDYIIADPLSITGSIGVTASYLQFSGLLEKYGITYERITSGEHKDIASPYRNLTLEERRKMEYIVNQIFEYFLNEVRKRRSLSEEQVKNVSTGDIFLGKDAVRLGLIDATGSLKDAKEKIKYLAGIEKAEFVSFEKKGVSIFDLLR